MERDLSEELATPAGDECEVARWACNHVEPMLCAGASVRTIPVIIEVVLVVKF